NNTPLVASFPSLLDSQSTFEAVDFDVPGPDKKHLRVSAWLLWSPTGIARGTCDDAPMGATSRPPAGLGTTMPPTAEGRGAMAGSKEPDYSYGVLLTIEESTDVASLEQRLHRAEYQASIGKLARGIAHELNSPLDGVLRYTHLALEQLTEDSSVREYLLHVKEGLDRMVRAVKAFLEFSRQVTTPVHRVADLNQLIEDTLLLVQHRAKFQQIRVIKKLQKPIPAVLDGGLQHAIVNLIKNAFDAMPRGGTLTITTQSTLEHLHVDIEDTGSGIPEEIRSKIFEPFFSTKPIHQGSGLGLIIAKEVVERSGGSIEFSSHSGVGTTFRIHVPIVPTEEILEPTNGAANGS
ncbi:MAG: hypothetical protein HYT88_04170, partial [Candidatus Omnitrophica bacterium]|nr:hypothetical protein [Candidatus Omnitrophota bacterium]